MAHDLGPFGEVWAVAWEFAASPGGRARPVCLAARESRTGRMLRFRGDELKERNGPPFPIGADSLYVAYGASSALGGHLALGWPMPARVLDLHAEFRCQTAGLDPSCGAGLLGALAWHGLDVMRSSLRRSMSQSIVHVGPRSDAGRESDLYSCDDMAEGVSLLLDAMTPALNLPLALLRGRYGAAVARMEWAGVPIDEAILSRLRGGWGESKLRLIEDIDRDFSVFDGGAFRADRWAEWVARNRVPWPRSWDGGLALDDRTFRERARSLPEVALIWELRASLAQFRPAILAVGPDGRNRVALRPFASQTGRNQPSSNQFIFGPATWTRGLLRPAEGRALAYVDWCQQEVGIAAALSGDAAMMAAYSSGDPYMALAVQAGQAPRDATCETHGAARDLFKACVLGVQYGMGPAGLAERIGQPVAMARALLQFHQETYRKFWAWSDAVENLALWQGRLTTAFGWTVRVGAAANVRSLRNFPCQANGAEMLRLACCLATERGVEVCAPVHDALLVEGPSDAIEEVVARTRAAMAEASEVVLSGFRLRTDARIVRWPERYMDPRGREMRARVMRFLPDSGPKPKQRG